MSDQTSSPIDRAQIEATLHELRAEHRDLDQVIEHLSATPTEDELLLRRLKKRKLALKDHMDALARQLVPDVPA